MLVAYRLGVLIVIAVLPSKKSSWTGARDDECIKKGRERKSVVYCITV